MIGPGKYDDLATLVRKHAGIGADGPGGVIVIVFGGDKGHGFAMQADLATTLLVPDILDDVARKIRADTP